MMTSLPLRGVVTIYTLLVVGVLHAAPVQRPNIVVIVADDLGWNDISFHGSQQIPTPNIDTLAYDGIILNKYYVQPICTPTRSALLTGRMPIHTGLQHDVLVGAAPYGLGLGEKILPQYLQELGYANHMVGKWHLGFFAKEYTPTYRGFDSHYGYYQGMEDYWEHTYWADNDPRSWGLDFRDNMTLVKTAYGQYSTELFTNRAEKIIAQHNKSQPLFLYLAEQAVHSGDPITPLEAPWKYLSKFSHIQNKKRRNFAGMVSALDDSVGNVTKALAAAGLLDNTVIIFTTDNGGPVNGFDYNAASNWPLRGCKNTLWEGGTRGAGFIWSPLLHKAGYVSDHMMHVTDWLPTILSAATYDSSRLPDNLDGMDFWKVLSTNEQSSPRTDILYNIDDKTKNSALRVWNWKVIQGHTYGGAWDGWYPPWQLDKDDSEGTKKVLKSKNTVLEIERPAAAPADLFKTDLPNIMREALNRNVHYGSPVVVSCGQRPANATTNCQPAKAPCLFDLDADPCEFNNVAARWPEVVKEMLTRMELYNNTAVPPRNKPQDPRGLPVNHNGAWVPWVNLTDIKTDHL